MENTASYLDNSMAKTIHFVGIGIIIPIGLISNILTFVVFAVSPSLRKSTTGHYLLSLAVADSVFLVGEFLRWLNTSQMHHLGVHISVMDRNDVMCKTIYIMRYVAKLASAWITVAITIERYITVAFPLQVCRISTPQIAKKSICCIFVLSLAMGIFPLWTVAVTEVGNDLNSKSSCLVSNKMYNIFNWISLRVGSLLLPGTLIIIFTVLICVNLRRAQIARMRNLLHESARNDNFTRGNSLERQLTFMLLAVAISFILFRLPYTILFYLYHYKDVFFDVNDSSLKDKLFFALKISDIFACLNYASNFFMYCLCGSTFRKQLKTLGDMGSRRRRSSTLTVSSFLMKSRNSAP